MKIYIVEYWDWDDVTEIKGVFTDKHKADKCLEYERMLIDIDDKEYGDYGRSAKIFETETSDDVDFDAKIKELEENERKKQQAKEDAIKESDLAEFNRIKEKYGL
jgi:uncharacterized protein YutD